MDLSRPQLAMTPPLPTREQLPNALLEQATWVGWRRQTRGGDETKVLRDVTGGDASATDPVTWTTFDIARAYATDGPADGVSYVFTNDDPFVGVAFDACRDSETGVTDDWAQKLINRLDSYTEVNPSGTGYHVIIRGEFPPGGTRTANLELYDHAQSFSVTGDHVAGTPTTVAERQDALDAIHAAYFGTADDAEPATATTAAQTEPQGTTTTGADDSRTATDAVDTASSSTTREASSAERPPTVPSPLGAREVSGRMQALTTQLESVLDENEQLQATLEAERTAREAAEARVRALEADEDRGEWSLFRWLRS